MTVCALFFGCLALGSANGANTDEEVQARVDALPALKDELLKARIEKLTNANTGASPDLQGLATSLNDLIPDVKLSVNGGDVSSESLNSLGFTYSPRIDKVADVGISVLFNTPELNGVFEEQGLITPEQATALGDTLKFGDSTEIKLTISRLGNFLGKRYGRSLADYQDVMDTLLDIAVDAAADKKSKLEKLQDEQSTIRNNLRMLCPAVRKALLSAFEDDSATRGDIDQTLQRAIGAAIGNGAELNAESCEIQADSLIDSHFALRVGLGGYVTTLESSLNRVGLFALPELVEQQPQLQLVAGYKNNDELAGPDEISVVVSWEIPLGNKSINNFIYSDAWKNCSERKGRNASACVNALSQALGQTMESNLPTKSQFRFSLSAEYLRRDDYSVTFMDPDFDFSQDSENAGAVAGSLYWKRYLSDLDNEPYVFEATLEYEFNDSDARNDRALFGLTASRNISNGLALSLGLVWANRPEFRGIVDQELTAKLGINYKLSAR